MPTLLTSHVDPAPLSQQLQQLINFSVMPLALDAEAREDGSDVRNGDLPAMSLDEPQEVLDRLRSDVDVAHEQLLDHGDLRYLV